jgi:hypothetical protein
MCLHEHPRKSACTHSDTGRDLCGERGKEERGKREEGSPRLHYRLLTLCPAASSGPQGQ